MLEETEAKSYSGTSTANQILSLHKIQEDLQEI
jgi:hypothetical protein